jgi:arylsulfatase A-like enzyme
MMAAHENVVVVVLDTVRGQTTVPADDALLPTIASLADEGTEFERAFTSAPWTLPSHASLLTGTYSSKHDTHGRNPVLDESLTTLAEVFSANGYETKAISSNTWISDEFGFDRGFDDVQHAWRWDDADVADRSPAEGDDDEWRTQATENLRAGDATDRALDWLSSSSERPFFLFLNYIDAHFEYAPPEEYVADRLPPGYDYERAVDVLDDPRAYDVGEVTLTAAERAALRALYRGELAYLDDTIGRLVDELRANGVWDDTVLVVTSDHGENVGDHGFVGHQYNLYDTLIHVPLVVTGGAFDDADGTADRLVQLLDLPVTLLDEVGIDAPAFRSQSQGHSFHPDSTVPRRDHVLAEHITPQPDVDTLRRRYDELPPYLSSLDRYLPLRAVRTERWKLVSGADGSRSLFDLDADAAESTDVADQRSGTAERLDDVLTEWLASFEQSVSDSSTDISDESRERLRNLGYL